jgi:TetR/AcrR family transcriptional regulator, cholesterol catabolism regulator
MDPRERIQQKATELFMRLGIRSVSMDDIAAQLGMSKKTIYQYFSDKDELVDAIMEADIQRMQCQCDTVLQQSRDAVEEIMLTMDTVLEQFRNLNPIVLHDLQKFHHRAAQKIHRHKNAYLLDVIRHNLVRGKEEGLYRSEIDIDIISRYRLESMMLAFNMEVFPPSRYNLAEVSMEIIQLFLFGLATPEGYQLIRQYQNERIQKTKAI